MGAQCTTCQIGVTESWRNDPRACDNWSTNFVILRSCIMGGSDNFRHNHEVEKTTCPTTAIKNISMRGHIVVTVKFIIRIINGIYAKIYAEYTFLSRQIQSESSLLSLPLNHRRITLFLASSLHGLRIPFTCEDPPPQLDDQEATDNNARIIHAVCCKKGLAHGHGIPLKDAQVESSIEGICTYRSLASRTGKRRRRSQRSATDRK